MITLQLLCPFPREKLGDRTKLGNEERLPGVLLVTLKSLQQHFPRQQPSSTMENHADAIQGIS